MKELRADIAKIESALTAQEHQLEACRERKKRVERQYEEKQKIVNGLRDLLNRKRKELVRLSENDNAEHDNGGS